MDRILGDFRINAMNNLMSIIHKSRNILKEKGAVELGRRIIKRLGGCQGKILFEYKLTKPPFVLEAHPPVKFCWATPKQLDDLVSPELDFNDKDKKEGRQWLKRGDLCLIGYVKQLPVTYLWIAFSVRELPAFIWPIGKNHVFFYKTFTRESFRGKRLNQSALSFALNHCYTLGIQKAFIDVNLNNPISIRAIQKIGFKELGKFYMFYLGKRRYTHVPKKLYFRVGN